MKRMRHVLLGAVLCACGGAAESSTTVEVAPAPSASVEPTHRARTPNLLRCPLAVETYELGAANDGPASAPVISGEGFVAAFTRSGATGADLYVQRARFDGELEAPILVRHDVLAVQPLVAGRGEVAYVVVTSVAGGTEVISLDPATASPTTARTLPAASREVDLGPQGLVRIEDTERRSTLVRDGFEALELPPPKSASVPREQLLASGPTSDLVLLRTSSGVRLATVVGGAPVVLSSVLFVERSGVWTEASVAAGPDGFLLVRTGPAIADLESYRVDASGNVARPVPITADPPARVRRYPRAAALGEGWVVSYWDGTGPAIVRLDAGGAAVGAAIPLRSGDERGGHTDARMVATDEALAVTWTVEAPLFNHGMPEEQPKRPGPRMAVLRCGANTR